LDDRKPIVAPAGVPLYLLADSWMPFNVISADEPNIGG
jgi:hypothetical protein